MVYGCMLAAPLYGQDLNLEEPPPPEPEIRPQTTPAVNDDWQVFYLKASYRSTYRLKTRVSNDSWGLPLNPGLVWEERKFTLFNLYSADSKIQVSETLSSYLRFDYYFVQNWEVLGRSYQDQPAVDLWEAYLDWNGEGQQVRIGGQQLRLGRVDFESPIDVLNLYDSDKYAHLDYQDNRYLMPALVYEKDLGKNRLKLYWAPFQRLSEKARSLRASSGVVYQNRASTWEWDLGLFSWLDVDNEVRLEPQLNKQGEETTWTLALEDAPLSFVFFSTEGPIGSWLFKGDFGFFYNKHVYHFYAPPGKEISDLAEVKTLSLKQTAFAMSIEKKSGDWFYLGQISSIALAKAPAGTRIFQFENTPNKVAQERNLIRHQGAVGLAYEIFDGNEIRGFVFASLPYRRQGGLLEWLWKGSRGTEVRVFLSHVGMETSLLTQRATSLNRLESQYSLRF